MGAELKLDDAQVNAALHAAILTAIGDLGREAIVKQAVLFLTTPVKQGGYYGRDVSPLMEIVGRAAEEAARTILKEKLATDPSFVATLEALYAAAVRRMMDVETQDKLAERLASKMVEALTERR